MPKIESMSNTIRITLNDGEKCPFKTENAFWCWLKEQINQQGVIVCGYAGDVVKKEMHKDGHMCGEPGVYYLRDRLSRYCIYDPHYAMRTIPESLKNFGTINLQIEKWSK